jgi:hypothetical protein
MRQEVYTIEDESGDQSSPTSSSCSSSSSTSSSEERNKRKRAPKRKKSKKVRGNKKHGSDSDSQSSSSSKSGNDSEGPLYKPGMSFRGLNVSNDDKIKLDIMEDSWATENRPPRLQRLKALLALSLDTFMAIKKQVGKEELRKNLGEEAFARDAKTKKIRYKAMSDDGKRRFHLARWNRQPLVPPEEYYHKIPKKRDTIVRNFPMEHLGISSQIPDIVLGYMHNRSVKVTLDNFTKSSFKAAKGNEKAGKYADLFQLIEGVVNYSIALHAIWPHDYTGLVILKVLTEARWGETAGLSGR